MLPSLQARRVTISLWSYAYVSSTAGPSSHAQQLWLPLVVNLLVKRRGAHRRRAYGFLSHRAVEARLRSAARSSHPTSVLGNFRSLITDADLFVSNRKTERLLKCSILSFLHLPRFKQAMQRYIYPFLRRLLITSRPSAFQWCVLTTSTTSSPVDSGTSANCHIFQPNRKSSVRLTSLPTSRLPPLTLSLIHI